jgi:hypothetical protein
MDFGLTDAQKRAALVGAKASLSIEIYNLFIRLGLDPDAYQSGDTLEVPPSMAGERDRLEKLIESFDAVSTKLDTME